MYYKKDTKVGSQNLATKFGFVPDCWKVRRPKWIFYALLKPEIPPQPGKSPKVFAVSGVIHFFCDTFFFYRFKKAAVVLDQALLEDQAALEKLGNEAVHYILGHPEDLTDTRAKALFMSLSSKVRAQVLVCIWAVSKIKNDIYRSEVSSILLSFTIISEVYNFTGPLSVGYKTKFGSRNLATNFGNHL